MSEGNVGIIIYLSGINFFETSDCYEISSITPMPRRGCQLGRQVLGDHHESAAPGS